MKKQTLFILAFSALTLASCGGTSSSSSSASQSSSESSSASSSSAPSTITVEDLTGRSLILTPGSYSKIVCVGAGALRLYSYVGDLSLLAGVEDIDNPTARANGSGVYFTNVPRPYYDAYAADYFDGLPSCGIGGPANQRPEMEKLIACDPDLIISEYSADYAESMEEEVGCPVFNIAYGARTVFDSNVKNSISKLGQILDKADRASELVTYIETAETDLNTRTASATTSIKAYAGGIGNWGQTNYLATHFSFPLFSVNNITNVLSGSGIEGVGQASISLDAFASIAGEIDVMFLDAAGLSSTLSLYQADNTIFDGVKAVEDGKVFLTMPYNAYYTNIETALMDAYYIGASVHPEAFSDVDIEDKSDEILEKFVGKKLYAQESALPGAYGGFQQIENLKEWMEQKLS